MRLIEGQLVPCGSFVRLERSSRRRGVNSGSLSPVGRFSAPQCQVASIGSTAGHRRGLVVEVAARVMEPDVPVFDTMDSVDEDEFDALSRRQLTMQILNVNPGGQ